MKQKNRIWCYTPAIHLSEPEKNQWKYVHLFSWPLKLPYDKGRRLWQLPIIHRIITISAFTSAKIKTIPATTQGRKMVRSSLPLPGLFQSPLPVLFQSLRRTHPKIVLMWYCVSPIYMSCPTSSRMGGRGLSPPPHTFKTRGLPHMIALHIIHESSKAHLQPYQLLPLPKWNLDYYRVTWQKLYTLHA